MKLNRGYSVGNRKIEIIYSTGIAISSIRMLHVYVCRPNFVRSRRILMITRVKISLFMIKKTAISSKNPFLLRSSARTVLYQTSLLNKTIYESKINRLDSGSTLELSVLYSNKHSYTEFLTSTSFQSMVLKFLDFTTHSFTTQFNKRDLSVKTHFEKHFLWLFLPFLSFSIFPFDRLNNFNKFRLGSIRAFLYFHLSMT